MSSTPALVGSYQTNLGQSSQSNPATGLQGTSPFAVRTSFNAAQFVNIAAAGAGGGTQSWQPIWQAGPNGGRVHAIAAFSGTGSSPTFQLGVANILTPVGCVATVTKGTSGSALDTLTRNTVGNASFVSDGWLAGDLALVINNGTPKNNVMQQVGAVTSGTTLTMSSGAGYNTTDSSPFTTAIARLTVLTPAISLTTLTATNIMTQAILPWLFTGSDAFIVLGPNEYLVGFFGVTPTAANTSTTATNYAVALQNYCFVQGGVY